MIIYCHSTQHGRMESTGRAGTLGGNLPTPTPNSMKFIVDNNVGRLAGWLRALGYDTLFINPIKDSDLVQIAQREGRTILTRDRGIVRRRVIRLGEVPALAVESDDWRRQLAQVVRELALDATPRLTRCMSCNGRLRACPRDDARPHVPPYVYQTQREFLVCEGCTRHYWRGTHWQRIHDELSILSQ